MKIKNFIFPCNGFLRMFSGLILLLFLCPLRLYASEGILSHSHTSGCYEDIPTLCEDHRIDTGIGSRYDSCVSCATITPHTVYDLYEVCNRFGYSDQYGGYIKCNVCGLQSGEWDGPGLFVHFYMVNTLTCPLEQADYGIVKIVPDQIQVTDQDIKLQITVTPLRPDLVLHGLPYSWNTLGEYLANEWITITENGTYSCTVRTIDGMSAQSIINIANIDKSVPEPPVIPEPPAIPEPPVIPEPPAIPEPPVIPETPVTPEPPAIPEPPVIPEQPAIEVSGNQVITISENHIVEGEENTKQEGRKSDQNKPRQIISKPENTLYEVEQPDSVSVNLVFKDNNPIKKNNEIVKEDPDRTRPEFQETKSSFELIRILEYTIWVCLIVVLLLFIYLWYCSRIRIYAKQSDGKYHLIGKTYLRKDDEINTIHLKERVINRAESVEFMLRFPPRYVKNKKSLELVITGGEKKLFTCIEERVLFQLPE